MKINHIALWVKDLEITRAFYEKYFKAISNSKYQNEKTGFSSYFLKFDNETKLEIMSKSGLTNPLNIECFGYAHIAINVENKKEVLNLTNKLKDDGFKVIGEPRTTGDGYFESIILDPDENRIEITC